MYKKPFKTVIILLLVMATLLSVAGCGITINNYDWKNADDMVTSLYENQIIYQSVAVTTEHAVYYVDKDIKESKRNRFVSYAEELLKYLKPEQKLVYYIYKDAESLVTEEDLGNRIHIDPSEYKSTEMIIATLQGMTKHYANYGLLYGKAAATKKALGWGSVSIASDSAIKKYVKSNKNLDIYDLSYPCFNSSYVSKEDVKISKTLSVKFFEFLTENYGAETVKNLIQSSAEFSFAFDHRYAIYMNEFLKTFNAPYYVAPADELLRYSNFTEDYPLRIETVSCHYYVEKDYQDKTSLEYRHLFNMEYSNIKEVFACFEESYKFIRNSFKYDKADKVDVTIKTNDPLLDSMHYGGYTYATGNKILVEHLFALIHEYTHSVAFRKYDFYQNWTTEALCDYFDLLSEYSGYRIYKTILYYDFYALIETDPEVNQRKAFIIDYLSNNNLPYSIFEFIDTAAYLSPKSPTRIENDRTVNCLSFLIYVINNYGMDKIIALYAETYDFIDIIGKAENQVIDEWQQYLSDKYAGMA